MAKRQKVLVLYLNMPSLEGEVISWATIDGTGKKLHMTGFSFYAKGARDYNFKHGVYF